MRFMMVVIRKGYETAAADAAPGAAAVARMEYNKNLQKAGVLLGLDGPFPPSTGACVSYADGAATVTDRPFAEAKEAIGGYWIIQVRSREAGEHRWPTTRSSKCAKSTRGPISP
jgi:hypothetical protein